MEKYSFGVEPITDHAWNNQHDCVVLTQGGNNALIYRKNSTHPVKWSLASQLSQHDLRVTGVDWAHHSNRIVTCAADRNAYVWTHQSDGKWKPVLVLLRINRAATCVRWSPDENKFAVGCGSRLVAVCYFEESNDWWVSKHIKKPICSTVSTIDWHPNNCLLAAGGSDFKMRVFSAYIKEADTKPVATCWGKRMPFSQVMYEQPTSPRARGGWIHDVKFSPDGNKLAWVVHDSSVCVVDADNSFTLYRVLSNTLPYKSIVWMSDLDLVTAGYGCIPMLYTLTSDGTLKFVTKLDVNTAKKLNSNFSAMRKFQSLDKHSRSEPADDTMDSTHQNTVVSMRRVDASSFSTTGLDGQLVIWKYKSLNSQLSGVKL